METTMKMRSRLFWICPAVFLVLWVGAVSAVELTDNLFVDGGMEEWGETGPDSGGWNYLTVSAKAWSFSKNAKGNLLTPKILAQILGAGVMKLEEQDVHSGKRALRLKGDFYLNSVLESYKPRSGDEFIVEYWVKGAGETIMNVHVTGEAGGQIVKRAGKPVAGQWTRIEERIQVTGRTPEAVGFRLWASEEMLIDDVSVRRVVRAGEVKIKSISAELSTRVAFASEATEPIKLDGRLDEPSWKKAIKAGGMRAYLDQNSLARAADGFRVLYDDGALYLGIEIMQPDCPQVLERLKGDPLKKKDGSILPKDGTYTSRHSVELFLQPPGRSRYYQLIPSLDGYRCDGAGMDADWNGKWEFAVQAEADRWVLEIRIPASDFELQKLAKDSRWRMNICINKEGLYATWAAVGPAFHNPDAFGELILSDFQQWSEARTTERATALKRIKDESAAAGLGYDDRLAAIETYVQGMKDDGAKDMDWEAMIKRYAVLNYVDYSYRCIQQEINYQVPLRRRSQ